jgi:hypothetical protein
LFIRTQSEEILIPVANHAIYISTHWKSDENNGKAKISMSRDQDIYNIGFYKNIERAREVMNEICKWIESVNYVKWITCENAHYVDTIFKMPKE